MMRIRPARPEDLDALVTLAETAGAGMTTLPANRDVLEARIADSLAAFATPADGPGGESYFLVLEDTANRRIAGTSAIYAGVGLSKAFYSYKILTLTQKSHELGLSVTSRLLTLVNDYAGTTEVGTLYLDPAYRRHGNGRLLARARYLLMASFPERFSEVVMAEMRGWQDGDGKSPFWEALGRHFFKLPFPKADYISGIGNNQFIADLMPKYPIYVEMLPEAAQKVIGTTHEHTRPALALLEKEGFRFNNAVDIFDAGPVVDVRLKDIWTVRHSRRARVRRLVDAATGGLGRHLACSCQLADYRAAYLNLAPADDGQVDIDRDQAALMGLAVGDDLLLVDA